MNVDFLDKFLQQSQTENLKRKGLYPESISDLDIKVSFGWGTPTYVPWIAILGPGMSIRNGYFPLYLFYKEENILILAYGINGEVANDEPWSPEIIKHSLTISEHSGKSLRFGDSCRVFKSYKIEISNAEVKYFSDDSGGREISQDERAKDLQDIIEQYKACLESTAEDESSGFSKGLLYMENQLEDFIIENWEASEFGKQYNLITEDGELLSQQYKAGNIGRIDILAKDKATDEYVVIELKRNQTGDETIGQIARYMQWVEEHLNNNVKDKVKGIIVCGTWDEKLDYARKRMGDVEVVLYEVHFRLKEYKK